jgi:hypothetical protein
VIVSDLESRLKRIENCQNSFATKADIDILRVAGATKTKFQLLVAIVTTKAECDSLKSTISGIRRECESVRLICALKEEVDALRSSSVLKTE